MCHLAGIPSILEHRLPPLETREEGQRRQVEMKQMEKK
jgi:hypothetical protein